MVSLRSASSTAVHMLAGASLIAAGCVAYAAGYEVRAYRLRRFTIPVLSPGSRPLRVLHFSDLHLTPGQRGKWEWLRSLGELDPDLVVSTGDHIAHPEAVPAVLDALEPLLDRPGAFVFGSNDYYAPQLKNPLRYVLSDGGRRRITRGAVLPWPALRDGLLARGWLDLNNATGQLLIDDRVIAFAGVDDPHLEFDRFSRGSAPADADLTIGVTHAPYLRVLDAMTGAGYQLILAGHTHGGQVCVPGWGALVTNCDLEPSRAKGVSRHPMSPAAHRWRPRGSDVRPGTPSGAWMHVSAGLGTSPYAPIRFGCFPEASLLTLVEAPGGPTSNRPA